MQGFHLEQDELENGIDDDRRRLIKLGLVALPFLGASLLLPKAVWAAEAKAAPLKPQMKADVPAPVSKPKPPRLLMIDPGHGGHDPGAIGLSGTQEKNVTLDIARRMAKEISQMTGVKARLTREEDVFLSLADRVKMGREAHADLFVSIHADSAPNQAARGLSAYTLSEKASDQFASQLADKENKADTLGGIPAMVEDKDVAAILFDLAARRTRNTAQRVKVGFVKGMGRRWELLDQPMRAANFAVLRSPEVPSLLIETGFLSNRKDEALLKQEASRQKIAKYMVDELGFLMKSSLFG